MMRRGWPYGFQKGIADGHVLWGSFFALVLPQSRASHLTWLFALMAYVGLIMRQQLEAS